MPRGASTGDHKKAYLRKLTREYHKTAKSGFDPKRESLIEGKSMAALANSISGVNRRTLAAKARLEKAKKIPAEENILRRGYNQGEGQKTLETLVDTKDGRRKKKR